MKRMSVKQLFGAGVKVTLAIIVLVFLGMKSIDFFLYTTPAEQWFYAYLGFALTGGGVIGYLIILLTDADSELKKTVSITMLAVCVIGELATAGFGMKIEAWRNAGIVMAESDIAAMILAVQILAFFHAAALIAYVAGDKIAEAFGDADGDGVPNYRDPDYKKPAMKPMNVNAYETKLAELQAENDRLKKEANPTPAGREKQP